MEEAGDGGGGGGNGTVDLAAFEAKLLEKVGGIVNTSINGFSKSFEAKISKLIPKQSGESQEENHGGDQPATKGSEGKQSPEVLRLQKQLDSLTKSLDEERKARTETETKAKETARESAISKALSSYPFVNDGARKAAERLFGAEIRYNDEGKLVAGDDEQPVEDFIKAQIRNHEYLLAPASTGGSGTSSGGKGARGEKVYTLDDIKPGMKPEELANISAAIARTIAPK